MAQRRPRAHSPSAAQVGSGPVVSGVCPAQWQPTRCMQVHPGSSGGSQAPPGLTEHDKVGVWRQGLASGSSSETNQLCDLREVSTLSGLQFPITHLSLRSLLFPAMLCVPEADF